MSLNHAGSPCPDCGHRTHRAEFDGEVKHRCTTDSCPVGWHDPDRTLSEATDSRTSDS